MHNIHAVVDSLVTSCVLSPQQLEQARNIELLQGGDLLQILVMMDFVSKAQVEAAVHAVAQPLDSWHPAAVTTREPSRIKQNDSTSSLFDTVWMEDTGGGEANSQARANEPPPLEERRSLPSWEPMFGVVVAERFRIESRSSGGLGLDTYNAIDLLTGIPVRLKLLPMESCSADGLVRFRHQAEEKQRWSQQHRSLATILAVGIDPQWGGYLVEEKVNGVLWRDRFQLERGFRLRDILPGFLTLCDVLQSLHGENLIHLNLHPAHVLMVSAVGDGQEHMVLTDWGVLPQIPIEQAASRIGKEFVESQVAWVPEWSDYPSQNPGVGADIYGLGVMLFELLTGTPLFCGHSGLSLLLKHRDMPPPTLLAKQPHIAFPAELESLLMSSLAKQPEDRPISVQEWLTWLSKAVAAAPDLWIGRTVSVLESSPSERYVQQEINELLTQCCLPSLRSEPGEINRLQRLVEILRTPPRQAQNADDLVSYRELSPSVAVDSTPSVALEVQGSLSLELANGTMFSSSGHVSALSGQSVSMGLPSAQSISAVRSSKRKKSSRQEKAVRPSWVALAKKGLWAVIGVLLVISMVLFFVK